MYVATNRPSHGRPTISSRAYRRTRNLWLSLALSSFAVGCVPSQQAAFSPIKSQVAQRTGFEVKWSHRGADDPRVRAAIDAMLAETLTADRAVKIALVNNQGLQAEFESVGISLADVASASVLSNPEIDAELRIPLTGSGNSVDLSGMQNVLDLFALPGRRNAAMAALNVERARATGAVVDLVAEVRAATYRAQADQQLLELRRTTVDSTGASLELTKRLHEAGNITDLALAQDLLLFNESKLDLARAEVHVATSREHVNALLGLSGADTNWSVETRLADLPEMLVATGNLEGEAVDSSINLQGERWQMKAAAARIGVAQLQAWLPRFGVGVASERESSGDWAVGPAVTLGIPIFDRKQGARARGHAELRQAQKRYIAEGVHVRADARAITATIKEARARALYLRNTILPLRQRVLNETLKHYNAMSTSPFELLEAKRSLVDSGAEYVESLYDYWTANAGVLRVKAGRMSGATMQEDRPMPSDGDEGGE